MNPVKKVITPTLSHLGSQVEPHKLFQRRLPRQGGLAGPFHTPQESTERQLIRYLGCPYFYREGLCWIATVTCGGIAREVLPSEEFRLRRHQASWPGSR